MSQKVGQCLLVPELKGNNFVVKSIALTNTKRVTMKEANKYVYVASSIYSLICLPTYVYVLCSITYLLVKK